MQELKAWEHDAGFDDNAETSDDEDVVPSPVVRRKAKGATATTTAETSAEAAARLLTQVESDISNIPPVSPVGSRRDDDDSDAKE